MQELCRTAKTPNEVRDKEELEPFPNGDYLLIQGATVPIGSQSEKNQQIPN